MKKKLFLSLLLSSLLGASTYELTPLVGINIENPEFDVSKKPYLGLELEKTDTNQTFNPEVLVLYKNKAGTLHNYRLALSGVHHYKNYKGFTPFSKAGGGFSSYDGNVFALAGGGVHYKVSSFKLKFETTYMVDYHGQQEDKYDSNLALLVGVSFAFGKKEQPKIVKKPQPVVILDDDNDGIANERDLCFKTPVNTRVDIYGCAIDGDDDNDGIKNSIDKCTKTPAGATVYTNGCAVEADNDGDGIKDSRDKCLNTPLGIEVDSYGCEIEYEVQEDNVTIMEPLPTPSKIIEQEKEFETLDVKFRYKSNKVTAESIGTVLRLAQFLEQHPKYKITILGYTDNIGSEEYNKILSKKRAQSIKDILVAENIDPERIKVIGMGEANPIASNETKEGRAQNRRIEVEFE